MLFAIIITLLDKLGSIFFRRENQLAREVRQHQLLAPRRSFPVIPVVLVLFMVSAVTIAAVFVSLGSAAGDTDLSVASQLPIPIIESTLIPTVGPVPVSTPVSAAAVIPTSTPPPTPTPAPVVLPSPTWLSVAAQSPTATLAPTPEPTGKDTGNHTRSSAAAHGHAGAHTYPDADGYSGPHTYAQTHGSATTNPGPDPHANSGSRSVRQ